VSNILTAKFNPFIFCDGLLIVPVGSVFVGVTFVLRDFVQMKHGKRKTYATIFMAILLSAAMSVILGDTAHIAAASAVSFFVSEAIDTEIFSRLKKSFAARLMASGTIGGVVDSALFVIVGISPIGANMLQWRQVPYAVIGQTISKTVVQAVAAAICFWLIKREGKKHEPSGRK
jgi:uncharacterized PurR-regulated membrane protein YhhQ (DUF165 family)